VSLLIKNILKLARKYKLFNEDNIVVVLTRNSIDKEQYWQGTVLTRNSIDKEQYW